MLNYGIPSMGGMGGMPNVGGMGGMPNCGGMAGTPNIEGMGGMPNVGGMGGMPNVGGMGSGIFINPNPGINVMMPGMNMGGNWMNIYNNGIMNNNANIVNNNNQFKPQAGNKINVIFKTTGGFITNVLIDHGKTMSELFQVYLKKVDKIELFNTENTIFFLFNANKISFTDDTKVERFFSITPNPTVVVNDVRGLIGA